jgi:actin-like ATPase involved in cell morphogenesis
VAESGGYSVGVDIGASYSAAAVCRHGTARMCVLGGRGAAIPSLVYLRDDQEVLVGEAAERRGAVDPARLARHVKRHVGDSEPFVLGGAPFSSERLMAALLEQIVAAATTREGAPPTHVAVCHPGHWEPSQVDLLRHALDLAGLRTVSLLTEAVAAAEHQAAKHGMAVGAKVAVYDLGGGSFEATVLQRTDAGFVVLGPPVGIERLGGVDFDEAVLTHVREQLADRLGDVDLDADEDPSVQVSVARLRRECAAAKEALSFDTETFVPVVLPDVHADVRLTRSELDARTRPSIERTVAALGQAISGAGLAPGDLDAVLMVGGSSQIPLVAELVAEALGRRITIDSHPKHTVALGAAVVAARVADGSGPAGPTDAARGPGLGDSGGAGGGGGGGGNSGGGGGGNGGAPSTSNGWHAGAAGLDGAPEQVPVAGSPAMVPAAPGPVLGEVATSPRASGPGSIRSCLRLVAAVAAAAAMGAAVAGAYVLGSSGKSGAEPAAAVAEQAAGAQPVWPDCQSISGRCAFLTNVSIRDGHYEAWYEVHGFDPVRPDHGGERYDHHLQFFLAAAPDDLTPAGDQAPTGDGVAWDRQDGSGDLVFDGATPAEAKRLGAERLCVLVADHGDAVEQGTGNCVDLPD